MHNLDFQARGLFGMQTKYTYEFELRKETDPWHVFVMKSFISQESGPDE